MVKVKSSVSKAEESIFSRMSGVKETVLTIQHYISKIRENFLNNEMEQLIQNHM